VGAAALSAAADQAVASAVSSIGGVVKIQSNSICPTLITDKSLEFDTIGSVAELKVIHVFKTLMVVAGLMQTASGLLSVIEGKKVELLLALFGVLQGVAALVIRQFLSGLEMRMQLTVERATASAVEGAKKELEEHRREMEERLLRDIERIEGDVRWLRTQGSSPPQSRRPS
jgi:hypothetical protein